MPKKEPPAPGLYAANAADWNEAIRKIPWEKLPDLFQAFGKRGSTERIINFIGIGAFGQQ